MHHTQNPYEPSLAKITRIKKETYDTTTYTLAFEDAVLQQSYTFQPGQFNMLSLFGIGEAPISISSSSEVKETFSHTIRHVGNVTNAIGKLKEGDAIWVRGPYGTGWPMEFLTGKNVLVVAGGIGLAPLRPVILELVNHRERFKQVEVLYGARTPADRLYPDEFGSWSQKIRFLQTVDMCPVGVSWDQYVGVVTVLFDFMESKPEETVVLTCGPEIMMRFVVRGLQARGFAPEQIYVSLERRMSCGVKKCGNCQIGPKFVCQDGPVFAYAEIQELAEDVLGGGGH